MEHNKPLISIITVCYNAEGTIKDTIESVLNQTYDNLELIVIDGKSTDSTMNIVDAYRKKLQAKKIVFHVVSEPDNGIYDAMNKGIDFANGEWINFMNAGDNFFSTETIEKVWNRKYFNLNSAIIIGDKETVYPSKKKIFKAGKINDLNKGAQFCHQSVFIPTQLHKENKYNTDIKIVADFDFFFRMYKLNVSFIHCNEIISSISFGGVSDNERIKVVLSWWEIIGFHSIKINTHFFLRIVLEELKLIVKRLYRAD